MAYPTDPLTVVIEFWDGTQWVDITSDVYARGKFITIRRGFPDEGSSPEPSSCGMELRNVKYQADGVTLDWAGRYSPRNPSSIYYGLIGRNTPIRVSVVESFVDAGDQIRYVGEISEWPSRWDVSGRDAWVPITAQGILRRLGQGSRPIRSPLRAAIAAISDVVAYWPCEDEGGGFGSAIPRQPAITVAGDVEFAAVDHLVGSAPLPAFFDTTVITGTMNAQFTDRWFFTWLIYILAVPATTVTLIEIFTTGGSADRWELTADSTTLTFTGYDANGSVVHTDTGGSSNLLIGPTGWIGLRMYAVDATQAGLGIYDLATTSVVGCQVSGGSIAAGSVTGFRIPADSELDGIPMGHFAVFNVVSPDGVLIPNGPEPTNAFVSETAADRFVRLCDEAGVESTFIGTASDTESMGPQATPATFTTALDETWAADMALVYETRSETGLTFRSRRNLYNRSVVLELDYEGAGEVAGLEPTDDDQHLRNDIEVKRTGGSSARAVLDTGALSVLDPPDGVGRYDEEVELNLYVDDQCEPQAYWRLHVGTWDELRYPTVTIDLAALAAAGKTSLIGDATALDVGDRIRLVNLPDWLPPFDVDLMVVGFQETIGHPIDWMVTLVCVPYGPYDIGTYQATPIDSSTKRYDTLGSTLTSDVDAGTDTSFQVTIAAGGALWTTNSASWVGLQVEAGGVIWDVTSITGSSSPQTINVTQTPVNGVTKVVPAGTQIRVAPQQRATYGL